MWLLTSCAWQKDLGMSQNVWHEPNSPKWSGNKQWTGWLISTRSMGNLPFGAIAILWNFRWACSKSIQNQLLGSAAFGSAVFGVRRTDQDEKHRGIWTWRSFKIEMSVLYQVRYIYIYRWFATLLSIFIIFKSGLFTKLQGFDFWANRHRSTKALNRHAAPRRHPQSGAARPSGGGTTEAPGLKFWVYLPRTNPGFV